MKKIFYIIIGIILTIIIIGWIGSKFRHPSEDIPENKDVLAIIRKEQKVKDATITDEDVLYAAVEDDGTSGNDYAEHLCMVLKDHYSTVQRVKIVKVNSKNDPKSDNDFGVLLGESWCK